MKWSREPVLISAIVAGLLVAIGGALVDVANGIDVLAAIGQALLELALVVGGGAVARSQAYSPETAETIMDADAFLRDRGV